MAPKQKLSKKKPQEDQEDAETVKSWQQELTAALVKESCELIKQQEPLYGTEFGDLVRFSLLSSLVSTFVYGALNKVPKTPVVSLEKETEITHFVFMDTKEAVEMAIERGFEGALEKWTGHPVQYVCQIFPEPVALNTEPC